MQSLRGAFINKTLGGVASLAIGTLSSWYSIDKLYTSTPSADAPQPSQLPSPRQSILPALKEMFSFNIHVTPPGLPIAKAFSLQAAAPPVNKTSSQHGGLGPLTWTPLKVVDILPISHDTSIFYFSLDNEEAFLDFPVSSFVYARQLVNDRALVRPYFPLGNTQGDLALMVKKYAGGPMSTIFHSLLLGDSLEFQGPIKKWDYIPNKYDRLTMIAAGTGITPMFQIIDGILNNEQDETKVHLIYANKTEEDILIRDILDDLAASFPDQIKVTYTIEIPSPEWSGPVGYIDEPLLIAVAGEANPRHKVLVCGPDQMVAHIAGHKEGLGQGEIGGLLYNLGYQSSDVVKF